MRLAGIEEERRMPVDDDSGERATELEGAEALDAVDTALVIEIADVRRALARLEAGTYGLCVGCGQPIGARRLAASPTAAKCIDCQRALI
ncbi:TraR/DksA C4-type zinc finger protein [Sphingomonas sp. YR710]|uniref:TraR/DksA family transcriptional regulator n=1 Tax=Sphingomonas sp. YR710 TaxID=1882773 RepID=UPI00210B04F2|nr:TraR/DksA C4-type zinc finger protein [Sphingomonas sp. YR710]